MAGQPYLIQMREPLSVSQLSDIIVQARGQLPADLVVKEVGILDLTSGEIRTGDVAIAGDRIVGILTPGEGVTIYPIQSPALKDFEEEPERWLDVRWDIDETMPQRFPARILVHNVNEPGSLAQIATVIAEHDGNIDNIHMSRQSPDFTELTIDLEVYDLKHLSAIIAQLRAKAVVARVERVNG